MSVRIAQIQGRSSLDFGHFGRIPRVLGHFEPIFVIISLGLFWGLWAWIGAILGLSWGFWAKILDVLSLFQGL